MIREASARFSDDRLPGGSGGPTRNKRIAVLLAMALVAGLVAMAGTATTTGAQTGTGSPSLVADPSSVPEPGTYDFTLTPSGFTAATNLAICNTGDASLLTGLAALMQYCGGFGSPQDATSGPFTVEDVEVGTDGVTFLLLELAPDGENAAVGITVENADNNPNEVMFSGTVTATSGASTANVVVTVVAKCHWDCPGTADLPDDGSARLRPLDLVAFLGDTDVDSSGEWSVLLSEDHDDLLSNSSLMLVVWDRDANLAGQFIYVPGGWESRSGIDVELATGGRASGRFATANGEPLPDGDYALFSSDHWTGLTLDVDPQTGAFRSPALAPGEYSLAHGNHSGGYLTGNDVASVQVAAGQTADIGTVEILRSGGIAGTITDTDGQPLGGIQIRGEVSSSSLNSYLWMPASPFNLNGSRRFLATTSDDGTYTAENLLPDNKWQVTFAIPLADQLEYSAIATGDSHTCAIKTDNTIACWGDNYFGQSDAPDGHYTTIAAGDWHSCAIRTDQTITCWGDNYDGQSDAPDGHYTTIAAGYDYSCAIRTENTIACWGDNYDGQSDAPDGHYTTIAAGDSHTCAIKTDQTINCWGANYVAPADAPHGQYTAIAAGDWHSCAIRTDQTINCWGANYDGQSDAPDGHYTTIAAGYHHSCAIRTDQTIACWGTNYHGQMDAPEGQYTAIAAGESHTCAIRTDKTITCWGDDSDGLTTPSKAITLEGITVVSGEITTGVDYPITDTDTDDDTGDSAAQRCFAHHKFGAEPVDVAKTADKQTVLAQLSWGYHDSIGCYLTLDETALSALRAAPAPWGFPAGDPEVAQQCSAVHKFGAQPVDVAKTADKQTVLAQVRWGHHDSIGCYLTLDEASIAALRAAHT